MAIKDTQKERRVDFFLAGSWFEKRERNISKRNKKRGYLPYGCKGEVSWQFGKENGGWAVKGFDSLATRKRVRGIAKRIVFLVFEKRGSAESQ